MIKRQVKCFRIIDKILDFEMYVLMLIYLFDYKLVGCYWAAVQDRETGD